MFGFTMSQVFYFILFMKFWNEITANSLQYGSNFKTWGVMNQQMNSILYILGLCYVYFKYTNYINMLFNL